MKNVPELRFKEFSGEWEERQLNKIIEISNIKFNPKINLTNQICIELEHISSKTGKLLGYIDSNNQESIKNIFNENQIIYGKLRPYLRKYWFAKFNGVCSSEFWVFSGKQTDNKYLYFFVQTEKFNQISNISCGSKMPRADWNYMSLFKFYIPGTYEQQKIASFLSAIDKKIELTDKKLEYLEKYKKGLMQRLLTGKVRFPGFNYEWKEEKLKNVAKIYQPQTISKSELNNNYNYLVYGANGIIGKYNKYNHEKEQILVSCRGANCGIVNFSRPFCWITGNTMVINTDDNRNIDKNFLYFYLKNDKLNYLITGSGQPQITSNIGLHKINLPSLPEQQKIVSFLSAIDKKIELIKSRLENLKKYKKGLLQKMFI